MRIKHEVSKIISEDIQNGENIEMIVSLLLKEARKVGELLPKSSDYDKIAEKIKKSQISENHYLGLGGITWKGNRCSF